MKESILALSIIDEGSLDGCFNVNNTPLVNVSDTGRGGSTFEEELFEDVVFQKGNPALLRVVGVDDHRPLACFAHRPNRSHLNGESILAAVAAGTAAALLFRLLR